MLKTGFVLMALALSGCALFAPAQDDRQLVPSEPYSITVRPIGPATVSSDGFEARFDFTVTSPFDLRRNALVQELTQTMTLSHDDGRVTRRTLSLVEAFQLQLHLVEPGGLRHYTLLPYQRDRHSANGLRDIARDIHTIRIDRRVFAYVANVTGADFSPGGFAHLPRNEDGTVVSRVSKGFNASHQADHQTRGRVQHSATASGLTYVMGYTLRRSQPGRPEFVVDRGGGSGTVLAPAVLYAASR